MARNIYPVAEPVRKKSSVIAETSNPRSELERWNTRQKEGTPIRDLDLQGKVLLWIMETLGEKPKGFSDFDHWIKDGSVLVKVMQLMVFNSVPIDVVMPTKGFESAEERVNLLIKYFRKLGVPETFIFSVEDLCELRDVPKVVRCMAALAKLNGVDAFNDIDIENVANNNKVTNGRSH